MKVALRQIHGPWDAGWVLDKHTLSSVFLGHDEWGHARFDTTRSEVGQASYQLKYCADWNQVEPLGKVLAAEIVPKFETFGFIVPMPASNVRARQPVTEVAHALGRQLNKQVFESLTKAPGGPSLKNLQTKQEKVEALGSRIAVADHITNSGRWNVLLVDDLYDSGASMEAATNALRGYAKVDKIFVAALTWK